MFSDWAQFVGAMLILSSISCVPGIFIYRMIRYKKARRQTSEFLTLTKQRAASTYHQMKEFIFIKKEDSADEEQSLCEEEEEEEE